jgi:hypothetical protein
MILNETVVTFAEAAARLPRVNGRKVHVASVWRWARKGVRGVQLEAILMGGRWLTSVEALERFGVAVAATARPAGKLPAQGRREAIARAKEELRRAGI